MSQPAVSIILASHNRRDVVLHTLDQLRRCELPADEFETIVVDNASSDGTAHALAHRRQVKLVALEQNLGSCAKAVGVENARAEFLLFLDDDSYPRPGCLRRMLARFREDPHLGAAAFTVHLPDGSEECAALPHVFVGCGVGLRSSAVRQVGGLDTTFFMQAEEYDLSFRLLHAGWKVEVYSDLQVDHLKTPRARRGDRTTHFDVRNNLRIIARYLPDDYATVYRADWMQRYGWLAERADHVAAFERGAAQGRWLAEIERWKYRAWRMPAPVLESVFSWQAVADNMLRLAQTGIRRVILVDLGKNVYAFVRGAVMAGIDITAIADDRFATPGRRYRDIPLMTTADALATDTDAIVVSNTSYVHAAHRKRELADRTALRVHNWFPDPGDTNPAPVETCLAGEASRAERGLN